MPSKTGPQGLPAREWESLFTKAGIEKDRLEAAKSAKARATILGNFLAQHVGREVPIEINGKSGTATLCMELGRAKSKNYYFKVRWDKLDDTKPDKAQSKAPHKATGRKPRETKMQRSSKIQSTAAPASKQRHPSPASGNDETWG